MNWCHRRVRVGGRRQRQRTADQQCAGGAFARRVDLALCADRVADAGFPTGRLAGPHWRAVALALQATAIAFTMLAATAARPYLPPFEDIPHALGTAPRAVSFVACPLRALGDAESSRARPLRASYEERRRRAQPARRVPTAAGVTRHVTWPNASPRPKVDVVGRLVVLDATAAELRLETSELSICEDAGLELALDYDLIFSCVDRPWARAVLNGMAHSHLVPVIDGGIAVDAFADGDGMRGATWRSHIVRPGRPCLACNGQFPWSECRRTRGRLAQLKTRSPPATQPSAHWTTPIRRAAPCRPSRSAGCWRPSPPPNPAASRSPCRPPGRCRPAAAGSRPGRSVPSAPARTATGRPAPR